MSSKKPEKVVSRLKKWPQNWQRYIHFNAESVVIADYFIMSQTVFFFLNKFITLSTSRMNDKADVI